MSLTLGDRLERDVAIKILPAELAHDEQRLSRFKREAKLLAALNHPGVATLYGFEEHDSTLFLVMELVDGETLSALAALEAATLEVRALAGVAHEAQRAVIAGDRLAIAAGSAKEVGFGSV